MLYNRESFRANNKKIVQPRNFSTANDLHYMVVATKLTLVGLQKLVNSGLFITAIARLTRILESIVKINMY